MVLPMLWLYLTPVGLRQNEYPCWAKPVHEHTGSTELFIWLICIWSLCCSPTTQSGHHARCHRVPQSSWRQRHHSPSLLSAQSLQWWCAKLFNWLICIWSLCCSSMTQSGCHACCCRRSSRHGGGGAVGLKRSSTIALIVSCSR
jgi:hypothetical protein